MSIHFNSPITKVSEQLSNIDSYDISDSSCAMPIITIEALSTKILRKVLLQTNQLDRLQATNFQHEA
jgi:hypothetical protein